MEKNRKVIEQWEKRTITVPIAKTGVNKNRTKFTWQSFQDLFDALRKSAHYRTITFDTVSKNDKEK